MTTNDWKQLRDLVEELDEEAGLTEEEYEAAEEDSGVAWSVRDLLEGEGHLPPGEARIVAKHGQVDLSGEVSWLQGMPEAEEAILKMPGVSSVTNHLSVRRYDSVKDLRSKVVEAIEGRAHRIASRIKVERQGGVVTLRGVASSTQYKDLAGQVAACAPGVERVENLIEVDPAT